MTISTNVVSVLAFASRLGVSLCQRRARLGPHALPFLPQRLLYAPPQLGEPCVSLCVSHPQNLSYSEGRAASKVAQPANSPRPGFSARTVRPKQPRISSSWKLQIGWFCSAGSPWLRHTPRATGPRRGLRGRDPAGREGIWQRAAGSTGWAGPRSGCARGARGAALDLLALVAAVRPPLTLDGRARPGGRGGARRGWRLHGAIRLGPMESSVRRVSETTLQ